MRKKGIKINFFSGPGAGKSTVAALLYSELKVHGFSTEMVREYAKELVYKGQDLRGSTVNTQLIIFAHQLEREMILKSQVDYIISDSPLLLNSYYAKESLFKDVALLNNSKKDLNIWIERSSQEVYETSGRSHTQAQSKKIDEKMKAYLRDAGIDLVELKGTSKEKADYIFRHLIDKRLARA